MQDAIITRAEAAAIIRCSEASVGRLVEKGYFSATPTSAEVVAAAARIREQRREALDELARLSEELGLYDRETD